MEQVSILPVKPGTLDADNKAALREVGIVVIEHENPTELRLLQPNAEVPAGSAEASLARNRATDALNDLNRAQNTFDEVIAGLRADQHPDSDWSREKIKPIAVSANT